MAHHIIGGEMYYTFVKQSGNSFTYQVTLKLYRGCEAEGPDHSLLDPTVVFSIFDNDIKGSNGFVRITPNIPLDLKTVRKTYDNPCIVDVPPACYQIGYYTATITLPINDEGYTIAYQRCCRNDLLRNANTSNYVGATYFTTLPGQNKGIPGDNAPYFSKEEPVLLCSQGSLDYTFQATDKDGDKLIFDFAPGYTGGSQRQINPVPAAPPPYGTFSYYNGFSGDRPLGEGVELDSLTGRLHGRTHLAAGDYDITIRIRSYRNGQQIATHYRDFQFKVQDCERMSLADTPPLYNECKSATIQFTNHSTPNKPYLWDFGDGATSTEAEPEHTFSQPGTYQVWLKVDPTSNCGDSMQTTVKVFPGVKADFQKTGNCIADSIQFADLSTSVGTNLIRSWHWDFGESQRSDDTSDQQQPAYRYPTAGTYPVQLTITTDSGCVQTDSQSFHFLDQPTLTVTSDTIFCYKDPVQLSATSDRQGTYHWGPDYRISDIHSASPVVRPSEDTTYRLVFTDESGCVNTDSVHLRIKRQLLVQAGTDTVICQGDPVQLHATSDDPYSFTWYNTQQETVAQTRDAGVPTTVNQTYRVVARLGSCEADDEMQARVVPYPDAVIDPSIASICYGDSIELIAHGGAFYQWQPDSGLSNASADTLWAAPRTSTTYTLTVTDTLGCPKPTDTTIFLDVVPPVQAFAGNDTIITTGQSIQLHGSGGDRYQWTPAEGLDNPDIADPIANGSRDIVYRLKAMVDPEGCVGYDSIAIRYIIGPDVYVPTAFTPNHDGQNDIFRPVPVGITQINYFRVYNRWGQLVYQTTAYMEGWDGTYKGQPAGAGAYVWMLQAKDDQNRVITRKGSVTLIR